MKISLLILSTTLCLSACTQNTAQNPIQNTKPSNEVGVRQNTNTGVTNPIGNTGSRN